MHLGVIVCCCFPSHAIYSHARVSFFLKLMHTHHKHTPLSSLLFLSFFHPGTFVPFTPTTQTLPQLLSREQ